MSLCGASSLVLRLMSRFSTPVPTNLSSNPKAPTERGSVPILGNMLLLSIDPSGPVHFPGTWSHSLLTAAGKNEEEPWKNAVIPHSFRPLLVERTCPHSIWLDPKEVA